MELCFDFFSKKINLNLKHNLTYQVELGNDIHGNITRIDNVLESLDRRLDETKKQLNDFQIQYENAKQEIKRTFPFEQELVEKTKRLNELNIILNINNKDNEIIGDKDDEIDESQNYRKDLER